jgi:vacuolar protein sorting-associated protein 13A/C
MSLLQVDRRADSLRFLDEADMTLSVDNRSVSGHSLMNIEMASTPIVFRASYRDINLILAIVNRAIALSTSPASAKEASPSQQPASSTSLSSAAKPTSPGSARVIMAKEQVRVCDVVLNAV